MTAEVLAFPTTSQIRAIVEHEIPATVSTLPDRSAEEAADVPLHEILRRAVVAYRQGEAREHGSLAHRHHLAIAHAYLDAAAIIAGRPEVARELAQSLDLAIYDIRRLTRIARDYDGPSPA